MPDGSFPDKGADVVCGSYEQKQHSWFRRMGTRFNDFMAEYLMSKLKDWKDTSFIVLRRYVIDEMIRYDNAFPYMLGLILRSTGRLANVPVKHRKRTVGTSGYRLHTLIKLWLNGATAFSVKPLRFAIFLGILIAFFGFLLGCWIIIQKFLYPNVPAGYSSLVAALSFFSGVILLSLGLLGEYVERMSGLEKHGTAYPFPRGQVLIRSAAISAKPRQRSVGKSFRTLRRPQNPSAGGTGLRMIARTMIRRKKKSKKTLFLLSSLAFTRTMPYTIISKDIILSSDKFPCL